MDRHIYDVTWIYIYTLLVHTNIRAKHLQSKVIYSLCVTQLC